MPYVIALILRFGRGASIYTTNNFRLIIPIVTAFVLLLSFSSDLHAIGETGLYTTQLKFEYQYSDYAEYRYPTILSDDPNIAFYYINPYISNFPEHRSLAKVTQLLGPLTKLEIRYEYSDLDEFKNQHRYFGRLDRNVTDMMTFYGAYQHLSGANVDPDSASNNGDMLMIGCKYDRSGWIKAETSFSYDRSNSPNTVYEIDEISGDTLSTKRGALLTETYMPMMNLRWSINSITAVTARWDGYWAISGGTTYPSHAFTVFLSRYFPTQTALHVFSRYYINDSGIESFSPAIEVAQYIRWNLTGRLTYRFYRNWFEGETIPNYINGASITAHSVRAYVEWQIDAVIKLHFKFRKYVSDQHVDMNTYLVGFEYEF
jgi:hypothetical protein